MATRRYEISLRVLKNISRVSAATPMKYQMISLKQFFPAKGAIYYVAIATVIFSIGKERVTKR